MADTAKVRTDGAAVTCPVCHADFGGMTRCPWDDAVLVPLADAEPTAVAFYEAIEATAREALMELEAE